MWSVQTLVESIADKVKASLRMEFLVIRKSFGLLLVFCTLAGCGRNVEPGDAQYPLLNKSPQRPLDITLIQDPTVTEQFSVYWYAAYFSNEKCSYSGFSSGAPARVGYSITVPLSFSSSNGALRSKFAFDMYERSEEHTSELQSLV